MYLLKVALVLCLFISISADDFDDDDVILGMIAKEKNTNQEAVDLVFKSTEKSFVKYNLSLVDDTLKLDKNGNITRFIPTNRMNIDFEEILTSLKFDTAMNKDAVFKCEFVGNTSQYCDHIFFTAAAADTLGDSSALLNMTKSFVMGNIGVEKKFDKIEFSKYILNNEKFIKKTVEKIIMLNIPAHDKKKETPKIATPKVQKVSKKDISTNATIIPSRANSSTNKQVNEADEYKSYYCNTEWIQAYQQKFPPPKSIKRIEVNLASSESELIIISDKSERYLYMDEIEFRGIFGLYFQSESGKSVELYEDGNLYILEGDIETLKAKCSNIEFNR